MKVISVFLASSIVDFAEEREELKAYVQQLNQDILVKKGIYLELKICELLRKYVEKNGKQNYYDFEIINSDYFILLSDSKNIGECTLHELEIALEQQRESKSKPKISICLDDKSNDVQSKIEEVYKQCGVCISDDVYINYADIESVKTLLFSIAEQYNDYFSDDANFNIVNIVLSSSVFIIDKAYTTILNHIASQNDAYVRRGIFTKIICVNKDGNIQKIYKDSADFYLITDNIIDDTHKNELDSAIKTYKEYDSPKIYTYLIKLSKNENIDYDNVIQQFVEILDSIDENLQHYINSVESIDQICLEIIKNLIEHNPKIEIVFKDGYVQCDNKKVMSLENIPVYKYNKQLKARKEDLLKLNESNEKNTYERKMELIKEINEIESDTLDLYKKLNTYYGCKMDPINEAAVQEFNKGNLAGVKKFLEDEKVLSNEIKNIDMFNNQLDRAIEKLSIIIDRKKILVSAIKAERSNDFIEQVIAIYEDLIKNTDRFKYELNMDFLQDYSNFMFYQSLNLKKAINIQYKYIRILKNSTKQNIFNLAIAYRVYADYFHEDRNYINAIKYYDQSINELKKIISNFNKTEEYLTELVKSYMSYSWCVLLGFNPNNLDKKSNTKLLDKAQERCYQTVKICENFDNFMDFKIYGGKEMAQHIFIRLQNASGILNNLGTYGK